jgi:hypothetical protein
MKTAFKINPLVRSILLYLGIGIGILTLLFSLSGCTDTCTTTSSYTLYEPVFGSMTSLRLEVEVLPPQRRESQGKIYIYGDYLLLGDPGKGIHIFDNKDKTNPQAISFVNIPGNVDMAVKDGRLYADSYVDLLVFRITDPGNITLLNRLENVFPLYNDQFGVAAVEDQVVTALEAIEVVDVSTNCADQSPGLIFMESDVLAMSIEFSAGNTNLSAAPAVGIGGSMARFTIVGDYLYAVDDYLMHVFDILSPENPVEGNSLNLGWGIETIFPYKSNLFIGSRSGMSIYTIDNPALPEFMSEVRHITTCDPVVANDDYAFVTLRSNNINNWCGNTATNQLDVIDITDVANANLLHVYTMTGPYGLGLDGNTLFVTEGDDGLKIFDVSDVSAIDQNMIQHLQGFNAYDVIPYKGTLILIGEDGLYQFDYSDLDEINLLSLIP